MDPFSIASGTVGIISLGLTVAQGLFQIANGIGSAGQEVRRYAQEIDTFSKLLSTVQIELDKSELPSDDIRDSFDEILHLCERALIPLNNLQTTLKPLLDHYKSSKNKLRQLGLRIKWFFEEKEKLLFYISTLGEEHRALNTLLEILNHRQTRHLSQNTALMELRIQNSIAAMSISLKASRQGYAAFTEASLQQKNSTRALPSSHSAIVALLEAGPEQEECEKAAQDNEEAVTAERNSTTGTAVENNTGKNDTSEATAKEGLSKEHSVRGLSALEPQAGDSIQKDGEFSDSADESLTDYEFAIINEAVERDLSSETPESAMEMWLDIKALKRRVERIALRTQASKAQSEPSNESGARPTKDDVAKEMIRKVDPKPDIDTSYTSDYTIGIICPGMLACEALRAFLDEEHPSKIAPYTLGRIGRHNIAIAPLSNGDISTHSAAVMAFKLQNTFPNIHMGLVVGPAGAIPSDSHDIRLGDVVVSYPGNAFGGVIPYDHIRVEADGKQIVGLCNRPPFALLEAANKLKYRLRREDDGPLGAFISDIFQQEPFFAAKFGPPPGLSDYLFSQNYPHSGPPGQSCDVSCDMSNVVDRPYVREEGRVAIHHGLIASGNMLVRDARMRERIRRDVERPILCVERTAAGVMNYLPSLVVCDINNYLDSHSHPGWTDYALFTAAAYTKQLLMTL